MGAILVGAYLLRAAVANAQTVGTFQRQLEPFCNLLTVVITQQASVFTRDGTDDQCGTPEKASTSGIAFVNPNGSVGIGLVEITSAGGTPIHTDATISLQTLSGNWRDRAGNSGSMVFTPGPGHAACDVRCLRADFLRAA